MKFDTVLSKHHQNLALIIGNGVNRYNNSNQGLSWNDLLTRLNNEQSKTNKNIPKELSLIEFYDLLELAEDSNSIRRETLQKRFANLIGEWKPSEQHRKIVKWSLSKNIPILTTNFDNTFGEAAECREAKKVTKDGFTAFYPWSSYYSPKTVTDPSAKFAIWYINGMQKYHQSIRLGLGHYMGSVSRARDWIQKDNEDNLFNGKNQQNWRGYQSWLHCIFNNDLLIFGLELDAQEVFLRWLFIERAKYFKRFSERKKKAWYVETENPKKKDHWEAKKFFLEGVGITPIVTQTYDEVYASSQWTK